MRDLSCRRIAGPRLAQNPKKSCPNEAERPVPENEHRAVAAIFWRALRPAGATPLAALHFLLPVACRAAENLNLIFRKYES
jgi:hypothetical protein